MGTTEMRKKIKKYIDEADDRMVKVIYSMMEADKENEEDWWDNLPEKVQQGILRAEKQLKEGIRIPHEEVMQKYKKWLTK